GAGEQRLREALNGGERGAKFVGNVGDKIAADTFEVAQFGDVVKNHYRAGGIARADGGDGGGKRVLAQGAGGDFGLDARLAGQNLTHRFDHFGLPYSFDERAAGFGRMVEPEDLRKTLIGEEQALGSVHYGNTFDHAAENGGRKIALFGERANGAVEMRGGLVERGAKLFKSIARGVAGERAKIAFGDAAGRCFEALDTLA